MCVIGGDTISVGGDTIGDGTSRDGVTRAVTALPPSAVLVALRRPTKVAHDLGHAPLRRGAGAIGLHGLDHFGHGDLLPAFEVARDRLAPFVGDQLGLQRRGMARGLGRIVVVVCVLIGAAQLALDGAAFRLRFLGVFGCPPLICRDLVRKPLQPGITSGK